MLNIDIDRLLTPSLCTLRDMTCMWAYVHASYMLFILHQSLLAALVFTARQKSVVARTRRTFLLFFWWTDYIHHKNWQGALKHYDPCFSINVTGIDSIHYSVYNFKIIPFLIFGTCQTDLYPWWFARSPRLMAKQWNRNQRSPPWQVVEWFSEFGFVSFIAQISFEKTNR